MLVLVINAGSSSLKYQLLNAVTGAVLAKGIAERIGLAEPFIKHNSSGREAVTLPVDMPNHKVAVQAVLTVLLSDEHGSVKSMDEIDAVGHRVVHGGERFSSSVMITPEVKRAIRACYELAPLHNPPNMTGIEACEEAMPGVPQVAVFDTAFHQTMSPKAFMYALPYELYERLGIRKYGFHGTSHSYVARRVAELLDKPFESLKIITCHLGNGSSIAAIQNGRCVDTSMGMTPLAGLCMGTRCGDIDPAIVTMLMEKENMTRQDVDTLMNKKSGVMGISGVSSDFRDLYAAAGDGHRRASLALDIFKYQCRKLIGSYAAAMGGVDVVVFTAGIGENTADVRMGACEGLAYMGLSIDPYKNAVRGRKRSFLLMIRWSRFWLYRPMKLAIARETARITGMKL